MRARGGAAERQTLIGITSHANVTVAKLDILDPFETVKVCVAYDIDGVRTSDLPADVSMLERAVPVYVDMPGWQSDTTTIRNVDELPEQAQTLVRFIARESGVPISTLGIGPARDEVMTVPSTWLEQAGASR